MIPNVEDILFPQELIPCDELIRLVVTLLIPFKNEAKGIECISGAINAYQHPAGYIFWVPVKPSDDDWEFFKSHLKNLPSLEFPIPHDVANRFIDKFILLKNSPTWVPSFLTVAELKADRDRRALLMPSELNQLKQQVLNGDVHLVDAMRRPCTNLTDGVFFTKREAIRYLEKKGLQERAFAKKCAWTEQIREPEIESFQMPVETHFGQPKELLEMGIHDYRRVLYVREMQRLEGLAADRSAKTIAVADTKFDASKWVADENDCDSVPTETAHQPERGIVSGSQIAQQSANTAIGSSTERSHVAKRDETGTTKVETVAEPVSVPVCVGEAPVPKFIGMKDVARMIGRTRQTIYSYQKPDAPSYDPTFPVPRKLNSENVWYESEIIAWMDLVRKSPPPSKRAKSKTK